MLCEVMQSFRGQPHYEKLSGFYPKAKISDRKMWRSVDEQWKRETVSLGEDFLGVSYPYITAADYMDFCRTGNRTRFEEKYFRKRYALNALVLAECVEDEGRFLDDIVNGIFSICEESAWQLPPHNTYVRDTPQLPLPDAAQPVLDLFACESGAVLATVYYLLKERLDQVSPFISSRIMRELEHRIFEPYLTRHFWWMGNGREPMNNWTIWCTQNVLLSVFLTDTENELREKVLEKACVSADYFLAEYGEDGCCDEGAQYYRHAGLCLFHVLDILNAVTDRAFSSLYREDKIKNIASYILNVHVDDQYYVNFADCSPVAGRAGVREFLFAENTGNKDMAAFAAKDFMAGGIDSLLLPRESNLFYRLENGFCAADIKAYAVWHREEAVCHKDIYYPSVGLFIARDERFTLAVKAGDNGDSHNHNDVGSFTVYKNGKPLLIDAGVESYTKKTFSPRRYEIWTMQSAYHNLPTVNGIMQSDGETYRASGVQCYMDHSTGEIEMDIAGAYPPEAGLLSYRRRGILHKGGEIVIRDEFVLRDGSESGKRPVHGDGSVFREGSNAGEDVGSAMGGLPPVVLSLMTYERPEYSSDKRGSVLALGTLGEIGLVGGRYLKTETIPVTDERLGQTWKHEIYRSLIAAEGSSLEIHIR